MRLFGILCAFATTLISSAAWSKIVIQVGDSADQPPFTISSTSGLSRETTELLNTVQDKYEFRFMEIPSKRLRIMIASGDLDLIAYDNPKWGWKRDLIVASKSLIENKDLFFTLQGEKAAQVLNQVGKIPISVVNGFHYEFANYKTDRETYKVNQMTATESEKIVVRMVVNKRTPLGIISSAYRGYLSRFQAKTFNKLTFSKTPDHSYTRHFLLRKSSPLSIAELDSYIEKIFENNSYQDLIQSYKLREDLPQ